MPVKSYCFQSLPISGNTPDGKKYLKQSGNSKGAHDIFKKNKRIIQFVTKISKIPIENNLQQINDLL